MASFFFTTDFSNCCSVQLPEAGRYGMHPRKEKRFLYACSILLLMLDGEEENPRIEVENHG
jgi:hypothetical protein